MRASKAGAAEDKIPELTWEIQIKEMSLSAQVLWCSPAAHNSRQW